MSNRTLWILAIVLTLLSALYQRWTGPTYPVRLNEDLAGVHVKAKLLRSHSVSSDLDVGLEVPDAGVSGVLRWRHFPRDEPWIEVPLKRDGDRLTAMIPAQPSAGKVEYSVILSAGSDSWVLPGTQAVVARFKGDVPVYILAPHIFFMFFAMLWSNRTGMEALAGGPGRDRQALTTLVLLVLGGLILGPIVQKYAFGAYWTGWPFGEDLTDNKLAVAVLAWVWAAWRRGEGKGARAIAIVAALIVFAVYMIPHSMNGSTLDYATGVTVTG